MTNSHPDPDTIRAALTMAVRAPSVHNSQPWVWRVGDRTVHLYADVTRHLPYTDPDQRELLLSCGAALHHLRVASRAVGWEPLVRRIPNPADADHLASVEFRACTPTIESVELARAIAARRTDRRRYTSWDVPAVYLRAIEGAAAANGALVTFVEPGPARARLMHAFERAAWQHAQDSGYGAELAQWSGRYASAQGVPARSAVVATDPTVRPFANPGLPQTIVRDVDAVDRLLVVSTTGDDRLSRLRAGEAVSAVLLTATKLGLASCPLTEPLEIPETRTMIGTDVLADGGCPQLIIRIGWAATSSEPVPATPRRALDEVVFPL
ncbi:Acg family FMN-binding oxidoreductase [Nocardia pseudobrasiliensis]|uniref:Nitroreductase family protein n=1 Tax=Nocardia pseudobrasiliensis TaxID=45979 RepID=A0A370IC16_9NOCA|nr:nitroreductase family protein [Nocardia pseudobrasiliensis]RDI68275.1 nitroreductase family protein [Nocardia pseudobrasiliensis]